MLFLASLDSVPLPLVHELLDAGKLPALRSLLQQGTMQPMNQPPFAGAVYPSQYGGRPPSEHGIYFPFQWTAARQNVQTYDTCQFAESVFRRVDEARRRMVVIDPPESAPQPVRHGFMTSGWQFRERVMLPEWVTECDAAKQLRRLYGESPRTAETFGRPSVEWLLGIYRVLREAPQRILGAAEFFLENDVADVLWVSFVGLHLASHQFYDVSPLDSALVSPEDRKCLRNALSDLICAYDVVLGRILERLPARSDVVVFCSKGMGPVVGWVDVLPEMLRRVLRTPPVSNPAASLRGRVPREWRERAAGLLSDRKARELAAALATPRADWRRTRAFVLPSDSPGWIRVNLRGRERLGIVAPDEQSALCDEIAAGLSTFTDFEGEPCIRRMARPREILGEGTKIEAFPDLVVQWVAKPTLRGRGVRSPRYGEILRNHGGLTGRSGDHTDGAWVVSKGVRSARRAEQYDIPVTVLDSLGLPHDDLPGQSLLA